MGHRRAVECPGGGAPELGFLVETMKEKILTGLQDSGTSTRLSQVLSHLQITSPANGDLMCQACGEAIVEGDPVTLYLSRPAGQSRYTVDQCCCGDHNEDLTSPFNLGVRELVVDGRIGQCRDHATQQAWPVLLAPSVRLISAQDTTSGRIVSSHKQPHPISHTQHGQGTDSKSDKPGAISSCQPSLSHLNRDGSSDMTPATSVGRYSDG